MAAETLPRVTARHSRDQQDCRAETDILPYVLRAMGEDLTGKGLASVRNSDHVNS